MNRHCILALVAGACAGAMWTGAGGAVCTVHNGDTNGDGAIDVSDAIHSLSFQFLGGPGPVAFCEPAGPARGGCAVENGDANGDEAMDISDAVHTLSFLFLGGPPPAAICPGGTEDVCDDGEDNDGDVDVDCDDSDCADAPVCLAVDRDGDGFTIADGDCDDTDPLVNPGAFDFAGDGIDDDCDGFVDPPRELCDFALGSNPEDPAAYALAMEICRTASELPSSRERTWGLLSAELTLLDGTGAPNRAAHSIRPGFGSGNLPRSGASMLLLSTGSAAAPGHVNPSHVAFQPGHGSGSSSSLPRDWLEANDGAPPNAPGCPETDDANAGYDPVMLTLRIRVPTNARSFRFSAKFFSSEYPEWVCSPFNDFFVVLLDSLHSGAPENPSDKNLAVLDTPAGRVPVGVNLAHGSSGLFQDCQSGLTGCADGAVTGSYNQCEGTIGLAGTGMDDASCAPVEITPGCCGDSRMAGGGSSWMKIQGNVEPGEVIRLRIALWDMSDPRYDSLVLIDGFEWSATPVEPGATAE